MDFLQIRFGHLKLTSATPGLSNPSKLRFKSNITGIFVTDICRIVGEIHLNSGAIFSLMYIAVIAGFSLDPIATISCGSTDAYAWNG